MKTKINEKRKNTKNTKRAITYAALFVFICIISIHLYIGIGYSQNISINTTGNPPNASALLDVDGTTGGLLIPRMTTAQRDAINGGVFAQSLLIYNTTTKCFEYWENGIWQSLACATEPVCYSGGNPQTTAYGADLYGCTGANNRCYNGVCQPCGGYLAGGYCWYAPRGGAGETCNSWCSAGHGGCINSAYQSAVAKVQDCVLLSGARPGWCTGSCGVWSGGPFYCEFSCAFKCNYYANDAVYGNCTYSIYGDNTYGNTLPGESQVTGICPCEY